MRWGDGHQYYAKHVSERCWNDKLDLINRIFVSSQNSTLESLPSHSSAASVVPYKGNIAFHFVIKSPIPGPRSNTTVIMANSLGNSENLSAELWYREFNRGLDDSKTPPEPRPDTDTVATPEQLETDFVDHWGHLLKTGKQFRSLNTYNELIENFWSECCLVELSQFVADTLQIKMTSLCKPMPLPMVRRFPRTSRNLGSDRSFASCLLSFPLMQTTRRMPKLPSRACRGPRGLSS